MEKPFGTDLASAVALNDAAAPILRRGPDLPHRPLPRQGGGAEHPGLPLRQRALRADLEPRPHRPRPDRRARDPRVGRPGRLLRGRPAPSRTWWSPTCSRSWPSWRWSRRPRSTRGPSARRRTRSSARLRLLDVTQVVRGQYEGYRDLDGVAPDSDTETFVALRCEIDNWRWAGVPFFLRTGKRDGGAASASSRSPSASRPSRCSPPDSGVGTQGPDHLTFDLADSSKLSLVLLRQAAGPGDEAREAEPAVRAARGDRARRDVLEAYERLIHDAMIGRPHAVHTRPRASSGCGRSRRRCSRTRPPVEPYAQGSWGPPAINDLIAPRAWRLPFERGWRSSSSK